VSDITTTESVPVVEYGHTEAELRDRLARFAAATFDSPRDYRAGTQAIAVCRSLRTEIEAKRKALKAGALEYGRQVDSAAKRLVAVVEEVEEPLRLRKAEVDDAKERERRAKEEADRAEAEARIRAAREAEERRLAEERAELAAEREAQRAERERHAELARQAAEEAARVAAAQRAEAERLAAERAALEAARAAAEREEAARQAAARAAEEARERAERERIEAEERAVREAERQAELARRREALRPERERVAAYLAALDAVPVPELTDATLSRVVRDVGEALDVATLRLEEMK